MAAHRIMFSQKKIQLTPGNSLHRIEQNGAAAHHEENRIMKLRESVSNANPEPIGHQKNHRLQA
ncbi:MAG: hypothetical protein AB2693_13345 [Candidatus Thiodiazotropha sp.]